MKLGETLGLSDDHKYVVHEKCEASHCGICDGGLSVCSVCGGMEGAMPTQCPGKHMTEGQIDKVYEGQLDFRAGEWVEKCSRYSPRWTSTFEGQHTAAEDWLARHENEKAPRPQHERIKIAHYLKHGDQKCDECVEGFRLVWGPSR